MRNSLVTESMRLGILHSGMVERGIIIVEGLKIRKSWLKQKREDYGDNYQHNALS